MIEDNPGIARLVRAMLGDVRQTTFHVTATGRISEGLAKLRQNDFDLVLLDLMLPDCEGVNSVQILSQAFPDLPLVVLTGLDDEGDGQAAIQAGAHDYLIKGSVDRELLVRTIHFAIQRHQIERDLVDSQERLRSLVENLPDGVLLYSETGVTFANPAALDLLGATSEQDLVGRGVAEFVVSGRESNLHLRLIEVLRGDYRFPEFVEGECRGIDGNQRKFCEFMATRLGRSMAGQAQLILRDIKPRKQAEKYLRLATTVFEASAEGMMIWDPQGRIEMVNEAFVGITGYGTADVVGREARFLDAGRHRSGFYESMGEALKEQGHWRGDFWARRKSGESFIARLTMSAIRDDSGRVSNYVGVFSDITDEKEQEAAIEHLANHDPLTGLPNRRLFHDRLTQALADRHREPRDRSRLALLFVDLDDFKKVNDDHGHKQGDRALQEIAHRIRNSLREGDTVARFGGDEFVVLLKHLPSESTAEELAHKVFEVITQPVPVADSKVRVGASIGIVLSPKHGDSADLLLGRADDAMYYSKEAGKRRYHFY
ncbi:diguanylate cyclase domain-containing protein [Thiohalorhabdus sp.]|uniref:diguanylate cyclase domain-containing protein n=1 Tax=Thiohalorhabdus sp. TaxID=3094134 RepID=UPI002FC307EC